MKVPVISGGLRDTPPCACWRKVFGPRIARLDGRNSSLPLSGTCGTSLDLEPCLLLHDPRVLYPFESPSSPVCGHSASHTHLTDAGRNCSHSYNLLHISIPNPSRTSLGHHPSPRLLQRIIPAQSRPTLVRAPLQTRPATRRPGGGK